jgi:hypothetical protein
MASVTIRQSGGRLNGFPLAAGRPSHPCFGAFYRWRLLFVVVGPSSTWSWWPMPRRSNAGVHATANTRSAFCHTSVSGSCRPPASAVHAADARFAADATPESLGADALRVNRVAHAAPSRFGRHAPALGRAVAHASLFAPLADSWFVRYAVARPFVAQVGVLGRGQVGPPRAIPAANMPSQSTRRNRADFQISVYRVSWLRSQSAVRRAAERLPVSRREPMLLHASVRFIGGGCC